MTQETEWRAVLVYLAWLATGNPDSTELADGWIREGDAREPGHPHRQAAEILRTELECAHTDSEPGDHAMTDPHPLDEKRLREMRRMLGLTQAGLAHALGDDVHPRTISDWETGRRPIGMPTLVRLALERLLLR